MKEGSWRSIFAADRSKAAFRRREECADCCTEALIGRRTFGRHRRGIPGMVHWRRPAIPTGCIGRPAGKGLEAAPHAAPAGAPQQSPASLCRGCTSQLHGPVEHFLCGRTVKCWATFPSWASLAVLSWGATRSSHPDCCGRSASVALNGCICMEAGPSWNVVASVTRPSPPP